MISIHTELKGIKECQGNLERYFNNLKKSAEQGAFDGAEETRNFTNSKYTPIDTGYMVNTSFSHKFTVSADKVGAKIVYVAPYAAYVEDNPQGYLHGEAFNIRYAGRIASGEFHARKPTEQDHFLSLGVSLKEDDVFNLMWRAGLNVTV